MFIRDKDEYTGSHYPDLVNSTKKDKYPYGYHAQIILNGVSDIKKVQLKVIENAGHFSFLSPFPETIVNPAFPSSMDPVGLDRIAFMR